MGLDQTIYRRTRAGDPVDTETLTFGTNEEYEKEKEFISWRKMNAIHGWMVKHVMDGIDENEGKSYWISYSNLLDFYDQLVKARLTRDATIFPPTKGFFFGGAEVDEYYWEELLWTIEQLQDTITEMKEAIKTDELINYEYSFWYESSW